MNRETGDQIVLSVLQEFNGEAVRDSEIWAKTPETYQALLDAGTVAREGFNRVRGVLGRPAKVPRLQRGDIGLSLTLLEREGIIKSHVLPAEPGKVICPIEYSIVEPSA